MKEHQPGEDARDRDRSIAKTFRMDDLDYKILRELQFDARISNVQLAEKVGLSATPCWNRLRRLEQEGIVEKYVTIFNQAALGMPDTVIIEARLTKHDDDILKTFEDTLAQLPEVVEAYLVTGEYDYYIKVAVAGTAGYEQFLREKLYKIPGIAHTQTSFTLRCLKRTFSVQPAFQKR
ncbi:MAG: Lrp/AsnC family transcriptional regulator [Acidobacteria bacterium]|nr:Lrp/AsnC family transcriptional regulator [Acidobacteriota bacterium]